MKKLFIFLATIIIVTFAWAPWMNKQKVHGQVLRENGVRDGSVAAGCEYKVFWVPFGRASLSCEGGPYFVPFWSVN